MTVIRSVRRQGGVTLIELIVFVVIVTVGLAGVLSVMNVTVGASANPVVRKQALAIAEAMLDEILSKDFQNDPADAANTSAILGCTASTTPSCKSNTVLERQSYNDVDDYIGWAQAGVLKIDGSAVAGLGGYAVTVAVAPMTLTGVAGKSVTVTVVSGPETIALTGFRANL